MAQGRTRLHGIGYLERGYEDIPGKLTNLGVPVMRQDGDCSVSKPTRDDAPLRVYRRSARGDATEAPFDRRQA